MALGSARLSGFQPALNGQSKGASSAKKEAGLAAVIAFSALIPV
jgi:hypothetical protein